MKSSGKGYYRMSLALKEELHHAFKTAAAAQGKSMTKVLVEFIEKYVAEHPPAAARPGQKAGRP